MSTKLLHYVIISAMLAVIGWYLQVYVFDDGVQ